MNTSAHIVAAVDLGASHSRLALADLAGNILTKVSTRRPIADGPQSAISWISKTTKALLKEADVTVDRIGAFGIGVPGPVEFSTGRPIKPPIMPGWDRFDIPGALAPEFNAPVLVDNDVNIMALGERVTVWPTVDNLIFVKISTGIGSGIISGGILQRGAYGAAGDIGHISIARAIETPCHCGNMGCLEAVASGRALAKHLNTNRTHELQLPEDIANAAKSGDLDAIQAIRQSGRDLGEVLSAFVSFLNPSIIVVGGMLSEGAEHLIAGVREVVYARSIPLLTEDLSIVPSEGGQDAALIGAAHLAINEILSPETINQRVNALT